jgi:hypothetical protein
MLAVATSCYPIGSCRVLWRFAPCYASHDQINVIGCHEFPDQVMGVNNCNCMTLEYDRELVKQDRRRQSQAPEWPSSNG